MIPGARWERGYRCHGLWLGDQRLGYVSLGPPGLWDGLYMWNVDRPGPMPALGSTKTLKAAKRAVERELERSVADGLRT